MNDKKKIIIAFVLTTIILTLLLPTRGPFNYRYSVGDTWNYEDLITEFDFPVLKSDEELSDDYKRLESTFIPIYERDTVAESEKLSLFRNEYNVSDTISDSYGTELYRLLSVVYEKGIIGAEDEKSYEIVRLENGSDLSLVKTSGFFTVNSAEKYITYKLSEKFPSVEHAILTKFLADNIRQDGYLTSLTKEIEKKNISVSKGFATTGTVIIRKGDFVDNAKAALIDSYRKQYMRSTIHSNPTLIISGNFLYVLIIMLLTYFFLIYFRSEFSKRVGNVMFILFIYIMMLSLTRIVGHIPGLSLYIIPFAVVPLYVVTFYDIRMSIFEFISVLMICSIITPFPFEVLFLNLTAGIAGLFVLRNSYHRTRIFKSTGVILLVYIVGFVAIEIITRKSLSLIEWDQIFWFVLNVLILIAMYQLIYIFEHIFGFVTNITLFELCDTNRPLLQELAHKAPGTFQHSLQVANLAEAAATAIGANALYARTGALYHDIGKMENPMFFIENVTGDFNPHDKLEPLKSVEYIRQHITDGIVLARKHKLPSVITDFIMTHHGMSKIYYFYHNYVQKYGDPHDDSLFCYPGPVPSTKEATICMMADSVEAASRSLKDVSQESMTTLVNKIVETQISENQFAESPLSLKEIAIVKEVFINKLSTMYHTRIEYPERD